MSSVFWALTTMNVGDYWVGDNLATLVTWPFIFLIMYTNDNKYNVIKNQFPAKVRDQPNLLFAIYKGVLYPAQLPRLRVSVRLNNRLKPIYFLFPFYSNKRQQILNKLRDYIEDERKILPYF